VLAAAAAFAAVASAFAANAQQFVDPSGDATPNAPDVTTIDVSNDDAGNLTFQLRFPNRPLLQPREGLRVLLDTDASRSTGDNGIDYALAVSGNVDVYALLRWDGSRYQLMPRASLSVSAASYVVTLRVNKADVGITNRLSFGVETLVEAGGYDTTVRFSYDLTPTPATPPAPAPPSPQRDIREPA